MMNDEARILMESVEQFCRDEIVNSSADIERRGISPELSKKIAAQGFYSLTLGEKEGGAAIRRPLYFRILGEFASHSPSVALQISLVNSLILGSLESVPPSVLKIEDIISGDAIPAVPLGYNVMSPGTIRLSEDGKTLDADVGTSAFFGSNSMLLRSSDGTLIMIRDVHGDDLPEPPLGFRGIKQFSAKIAGAPYENLGRIHNDVIIDGEIAAIAAGIARGSISKAIEYSRVRKTFDHPLKDYGPVAFRLSELSVSLRMLENYIYSDTTSDEDLIGARVFALKLANQASREAVQTHGGYGYIEDFGVEKYYRDAMALASLLSNHLDDLSRLSKFVYHENAGFI